VWKPRAQNCCLGQGIDGPSILPNPETAPAEVAISGNVAIFRTSSNIPLPNPALPALLRAACSLCRTINKYYYIILALFPHPKWCPG